MISSAAQRGSLPVLPQGLCADRSRHGAEAGRGYLISAAIWVPGALRNRGRRHSHIKAKAQEEAEYVATVTHVTASSSTAWRPRLEPPTPRRSSRWCRSSPRFTGRMYGGAGRDYVTRPPTTVAPCSAIGKAAGQPERRMEGELSLKSRSRSNAMAWFEHQKGARNVGFGVKRPDHRRQNGRFASDPTGGDIRRMDCRAVAESALWPISRELRGYSSIGNQSAHGGRRCPERREPLS